jgi:hypothetical protein
MPQKGTYTALQQLRPIQTDFGKIATDAAAVQHQRDLEVEAKRAATAKARQEQKSKIAEGFREDYAKLTEVVTGTKSLTEAMSRGVGAARDMLGETYKEIERNPAMYDDINVSMKVANASNFSKNLKLVSDRYTEYAAKVTKGMTDGSLSEWNNETLNDLNSIFKDGNLDVTVDPQTGLPIAVFAKQDDDGNYVYDDDGEVVMERMNLLEVLDGRGLQDTPSKFDLAKHAQTAGKDLGDRMQKTEGGDFTTREIQTFEMIEPEVRDLAKGLIGTAQNPTDVAKSIWTDTLGNNKPPGGELTEADMSLIEDAYVNATRPFYDEKDKADVNFGARNAAKKLAKEEAAKTPKGEIFEVVTDQEGDPTNVQTLVGVSGDIGGGAMAFSMPRDPKNKYSGVAVEKEGKRLIVDRIYLTNSGEVAYSGYSIEGRSSGELIDPTDWLSGKISTQVTKSEFGGGADPGDKVLTDLARAVGLSGEAELKKALQTTKDRFGLEAEGEDTGEFVLD